MTGFVQKQKPNIPSDLGIGNHIVSIGMPVYNGEQFLRKALDSLLSQTFSNFELIISDNASTDATPSICKEYVKKDNRVQYFRQSTNVGAYANFKFVLDKSKHQYFMWAAADDYWDKNFLKKNLDVLISNDNVVCTISKIKTYSLPDEANTVHSVQYPKWIRNFVKKRRDALISVTFPVSGSYAQKIRSFLKNPGSNSRFYGLYRIEQLRKCYIDKPFVTVENAIFLNLLKYGDLYEVDEVLMYRYSDGISTIGIINYARNVNGNLLGIIFPYYPFNMWCLKNLGIKNILRNIDIFSRLNLAGVFFLIIDFVLLLKKKYL